MPDQVTQVQPSGNGGGGGFGPGLIIGIIVVVLILIALYFFWGMAGNNGGTATPQNEINIEVPDTLEAPDNGLEIPSEIDVNINTPTE